jgi:septin family protein
LKVGLGACYVPVYTERGISQVLKTRTREVLYEKYRTEKLLAWRATRSIDQEETKRMLEGKLSTTVQIQKQSLLYRIAVALQI